MAAKSHRIALLPENVRSEISSASEIVSYEQVIEGLFRNALDARAQSIVIEVDLAKGDFTISDDGDGVEEAEFSSTGHLAKLHCANSFSFSWSKD